MTADNGMIVQYQHAVQFVSPDGEKTVDNAVIQHVQILQRPTKIIKRRDGSGLWVYLGDTKILSIEHVVEDHGIINLDDPNETPPDDISNWEPSRGLTARDV